MRKIIIFLLFIAVIYIVGVPLFMLRDYLIIEEYMPVDQYPDGVPENENAMTYYKKAKLQLDLSKEDEEFIREIVADQAIDKDKLNRILDDNEEVFKLIKKGNSQPYCYYSGNIIEKEEGFYSSIVNIARILDAETTSLIKDKQYQKAGENMKTINRLGSYLMKMQNSLVTAMVSVAIRNYAVYVYQFFELVFNSGYDCADAKEVWESLKLQEDEVQAFKNSLNMEKRLLVESLNNPDSEYYFEYSTLIRFSCSAFFWLFSWGDWEEDVDSAFDFCFNLYPYMFENVEKYVSRIDTYCEPVISDDSENVHSLNESVNVNYSDYLFKHCQMRSWYAAANVFIGLKCYMKDHGKLPESLEDLVPEYLDEIPKDPFGNGEMKYSEEKKIVYSIGADFADMGGAEFEEKRQYNYDTENPASHWNEPTFKIMF